MESEFRNATLKTIADYPNSMEAYVFNIYVIPICLAISNLAVLAGVFTEALDRLALYNSVLETMQIPIVSSRDCLMLNVILQVIGDLWTPIIEILMGVERFTAVWFPAFFRAFFAPHPKRLIGLTVILTFIILAIPSAITIISPTPDVKYQCGRKAALSDTFGLIDYSFNVIGYSSAFILNVLAAIRASFVRQSAKTMSKIRSYTIISFLSTLLISTPNLVSTLDALDIHIPNDIRRPTVVMTGLNSAVLFFVYLIFNVQYRLRFFEIATLMCPRKLRVHYVSSDAGAKTVMPTRGNSTSTRIFTTTATTIR
uniref:G_PROTEIN_RECEP_F1_2 domain-containing protein n=1 Tax=Panagrellus redivivus TaxID=6233 RepID=A0A7E4W1B3_PANRE